MRSRVVVAGWLALVAACTPARPGPADSRIAVEPATAKTGDAELVAALRASVAMTDRMDAIFLRALKREEGSQGSGPPMPPAASPPCPVDTSALRGARPRSVEVRHGFVMVSGSMASARATTDPAFWTWDLAVVFEGGQWLSDGPHLFGEAYLVSYVEGRLVCATSFNVLTAEKYDEEAAIDQVLPLLRAVSRDG